jgi:aspartate/methionine/tyrosine aminotransferase
VIPSQGTYFLNIDIAPLGETDDAAFCRRLVMDHGVAAIPVSPFTLKARSRPWCASVSRSATPPSTPPWSGSQAW